MTTTRTTRLNSIAQRLENEAHADAARINNVVIAQALIERSAPGIAPIEPAALAALFAETPSAAWAALAQLTNEQLTNQAIEYACYLEQQGTERKWIAIYDCWVARLAARAALAQAEAEALAAHAAIKAEADALAAPDYETYAAQTEAVQASALAYFDRRADRERADGEPTDAAIAAIEAQLVEAEQAWADLCERAERGQLDDSDIDAQLVVEEVEAPPAPLISAQSRDKAAYRLADGVAIRRVGDAYLVPSANTAGQVYRVEDGRCSCKAGQAGRSCWHVAAAAQEARADEAQEVETMLRRGIGPMASQSYAAVSGR